MMPFVSNTFHIDALNISLFLHFAEVEVMLNKIDYRDLFYGIILFIFLKNL